MEILSMEYYNKFRCSGSECEDHCCKGWAITIDKKTFKTYKNLKNNEFSKKLKSSIVKNKNSVGTNNYGRFKLVDGTCPLFSEEGLCEVYLNIGEENMCNTCKVYPRMYNKVNDRIEVSITLSCIEVAKNILLDEKPIEFNLDNGNTPKSGLFKVIDKNNESSYLIKSFDEIREFCIGLIQERKYNIEERLAILGLFIKNLSEVDNKALVTNLINEYKNRISCSLYDGILDKIGIDQMLEIQNVFCTGVYNVILSKGINDKRFIDKFKISSEYLKLNQNDINVRKDILKETLENEYDEFISKYRYIYENYLVSYMFKSLFPISDMSINDTYNDLIIRFSLIKITIIGLCGYYKDKMDVDYTVEFIQSFVKVVEHDATIVEKLNDYLKQNNMNTLAHMMIMMGK